MAFWGALVPRQQLLHETLRGSKPLVLAALAWPRLLEDSRLSHPYLATGTSAADANPEDSLRGRNQPPGFASTARRSFEVVTSGAVCA